MAGDPATHADLVVKSGQIVVIQPTQGSQTYYQGGNITVESGGTLIVRNTTLSFVQYVPDYGTLEQRLSHLYQFVDNGTVNLYNSAVTTDVLVLNAYAKLNLTVTAELNAWNTTFAFPGWFNIQGSKAVVTLNASTITWNLAVCSRSSNRSRFTETGCGPRPSMSAVGPTSICSAARSRTSTPTTRSPSASLDRPALQLRH